MTGRSLNHTPVEIHLLPWLAPFAAWSLGVLFVFHRVILSGFVQSPGGQGDARLVNYTLEHGYRWLVGWTGHERFWDPPLFFPHSNVSAYTDVMLGLGPLYWCWRAIGMEPDTSFQIWTLLVWSLNFLVGYVFLRHCFSVLPLAGAMGAFLFAFGSSRSVNIGHPQLVPFIYIILCLFALFRFFEHSGHGDGRAKARGWLACFFLAITLQFYTAFYNAFFFVLILAVAFMFALFISEIRRKLWAALSVHFPVILIIAGISLLIMLPLISHYVMAVQEVEERSYRSAEQSIPRWCSWLLMGRRNVLFGWLQESDSFSGPLARAYHSNGVGFVTLALAVMGLIAARKKLPVRLIILTTVGTILLTTMFPGGFTVWKFLYHFVPGAGALRTIGRIGTFLLIPASVGISLYFQSLVIRRRWWVIAVLALLCCAEQKQKSQSFSKIEVRERIAALSLHVDPACQAFYLASRNWRQPRFIHDDAAWVQIATGIPTVNGRYGNSPRDWDLKDTRSYRPKDRRRLQTALKRWATAYGLDAQRVCWIELPLKKDRTLDPSSQLSGPD
ncbi:hypothetical protein ACFLU6_10140 [Acidobacteriota bacterium]